MVLEYANHKIVQTRLVRNKPEYQTKFVDWKATAKKQISEKDWASTNLMTDSQNAACSGSIRSYWLLCIRLLIYLTSEQKL